MNKEKFAEIERMLREDCDGGGPLRTYNDFGIERIDFRNILEGVEKRNMIILVKYHPEDKRYGFTIYKEGVRK